ncbi:hypothetical protein IFM89_009945 [Coptis chinensis]|uniref:SHSP domain-containing protein n=1 Tax=Coptis chinensis TaxID=261450 RepID=A0A835HIY6_9MAGN|nr:hypothetical protein IFM89_009945 [Coptis chinensis]
MASSIFLKRMTSSLGALQKLRSPAAILSRPTFATRPSTLRFFSNKSVRGYEGSTTTDDDDDESFLEVVCVDDRRRRRSSPSLLSGNVLFVDLVMVVAGTWDYGMGALHLHSFLIKSPSVEHNADGFDPSSASNSINQVLDLMDELVDHPYLSGSRERRPWSSKDDNNALKFRMDMPGLGKEDVKVSVEANVLIIKGEGPEEADEDDEEVSGNYYTAKAEFPANRFKLDQIKAEMKNGVLKVTVPKVEAKNVVQVNVD